MDIDLYHKWKSILLTYLGRTVQRHCDGLIMDLMAVDLGLKPAYLYDIGNPAAGSLVTLLEHLHQARLITHCLNVVELGSDLIIVNVAEVHKLSENLISLDLILIDVSGSNRKPKKLGVGDGDLEKSNVYYYGGEHVNEIKKCFRYILEKLDISKVSKVDTLVTCNLTSLFGTLLGYPVIYWFSTDGRNQDNCLAGEQLTCVKVCVKLKINSPPKHNLCKDHVLYSFSYPTELEHYYLPLVDKWIKDISDRVHKDNYFCMALVDKNICVLDAVCL